MRPRLRAADPARAAGRGLLVLLACLSLGAVQAPPAGSPPPPTTPGDSPRDVLSRVLAQPEFHPSQATLLMERLRERATHWLADLWTRLGGSRFGSRDAATTFAWVIGLLALAALTWWFVQSLRRASERHALGLPPPARRRRSSRAWTQDALAAYDAGAMRESARCAYRAALARLEEEGAWRQDDARTPREYVRMLPSSHRRRAAVADMTSRFERAWYDTGRGSPDDARAMLAQLEELGCLASGRAM
jgi:hypothetical protein